MFAKQGLICCLTCSNCLFIGKKRFQHPIHVFKFVLFKETSTRNGGVLVVVFKVSSRIVTSILGQLYDRLPGAEKNVFSRNDVSC